MNRDHLTRSEFCNARRFDRKNRSFVFAQPPKRWYACAAFMRNLVAPICVAMLFACGSVDDPPLGGPYGGTTDSTDPNGGQNGDNNTTSDDSGTQPQQDSGTQPTKDSGTTTKDSGTTTKDSGTTTTAPTWTAIFNDYLAGSKEGRCSGCHSQGSSASNLYSWLQGKGYISGTSSKLVSNSQSCLSWYGGNMPPSGPSDATAVSDMNAWAAAGAANN